MRSNSGKLLLILVFAFFIPASRSFSNDPNDIGFYLYPNPSDVNDCDVLTYDDVSSISSSRFDPSKPRLLLLIHGFAQNYTDVFPQVIKNAYLQNGFADDANIVTVDWGKLSTPDGASLPWPADVLNANLSTALVLVQYFSAAGNVPVVTRRLAEFLIFLQGNGFLRNGFSDAHAIGMSMGAHVAGELGPVLQESFPDAFISRITGLDPAGPGFQGNPPASRLDKEDAAYVDVVHTNQGGFGYLGGLGDADFYVNGGGPLPQPGCPLLPTTSASAFCSHAKSIYYFAASISNPNLKGCKCVLGLICTGPCTTFGEYSTPASASGDYYLNLTTNP